jgi:hypothetical protein
VLELKAALKDKQLKVRQTEEVRTSQKADIESRHTAEFKDFNDEWEESFNKYNEGCEQIEATLKAQQQAKCEEVKERLRTNTQPTKYSVEYLNLQRILKTVVKNKDYKEAHAIQDRMNSLAEAEKKQWELQQQARSEHQLAQLRRS